MNYKTILVTLLTIVPTLLSARFEQELIQAVRNGDSARVQQSLNKGADPNAYDECNLLSIAAQNGRVDIVEILLKAGAHPEWITTADATPEYIANRDKIIELIYSHAPEELYSPVVQALLERKKRVANFSPEDIIAVLTSFEQLCVPYHGTDPSVHSQTHLVLFGVLLSALSHDLPVGKHIEYLNSKWMYKTIDSKDRVSLAIQSIKDAYTSEEIWKKLKEGYLMCHSPECLALIRASFTKATLFEKEFANAFDYHNISLL